LSITLEVEFCIEAVEEALVRYGTPEIFNTDSKNDRTGASRGSIVASDKLREYSRYSAVSQLP
jgi:hypothetical protein